MPARSIAPLDLYVFLIDAKEECCKMRTITLLVVIFLTIGCGESAAERYQSQFNTDSLKAVTDSFRAIQAENAKRRVERGTVEADNDLLVSELTRLANGSCTTTVYFEKVRKPNVDIRRHWYANCPECPTNVRVDSFLPQLFTNLLELYAVGDRITATQLMRYTGEC